MARLFARYSIILLLLLVANVFPDCSGRYDYISLFQDVYNYYGTSCVVIVKADARIAFNHSSISHALSHVLTKRGILSVIVSMSDLARGTLKHQRSLIRPLYTLVFAKQETLDLFIRAAKHIDMSSAIWFILFLPYKGKSPLRNFCEGPEGNPFNLLFNTEMLVLCYESKTLREWYAIRDNQTRVFDLASRTPDGHMILNTESSLYGRRNNMFGEKIRVSILEDSLFIKQEGGVLSLFIGAVIEELSQSINFTIDVVSSIPSYGSWDKETKRWSGVIGEVVSNRADFGVAEFSMTKHRLDVVDFTVPLILSRNKIFFKKPDSSSVQWSAYFKAFSMNIWIVLICVITSAPILLTITKTRGRFEMSTLVDNFVQILGIYCQQSLSEFPRETSTRLVLLPLFMSSMIIFAAYAAALISCLTVTTVSLPFTTIEEFANYKSYKLIVFKHSADYEVITAAEDRVFAKVKRLLKHSDNLPLTAYEGFSQVCSENVGFYVTEAIRNAINDLPCETVFIEADGIDALAPVLTKGSPYTGIINYHLHQFKANGVLNRLRNKYMVPAKSPDTGYLVVGMGGIAPVLAIVGGGLLLAFVTLILEKMYQKLSYKKDTNHSQSTAWNGYFNGKIINTYQR